MATPQVLNFQSFGSSLPILIIHGWEISGDVEAHDFEPIFTKHPNYRRLYIDLPGMGKTPINENIKDLDSMLDCIYSFVDKHIHSNFLVTGSSCGAYLARAVAYKYASQVEGLLLRVPVVEPENENRDVDQPVLPAIANEKVVSSIPKAQQLGQIAVQTPQYISSLQERFNSVVKPALAASEELDAIRNDPNRYRVTKEMHSSTKPFDKPTLILTGRQDTVVGYRDAWTLMTAYPRATFAAIDRMDHGLPVDESDVSLFRALVENWLGRVEEALRGRWSETL